MHRFLQRLFRPRSVLVLVAMGAAAGVVKAQSVDAQVRSHVEAYNRAMITKDLVGLKALLDSGIVLYEHSVRNIGLDDVWEHHLKPEVAGFENMKAEFTDVRVTASADLALVTRQYAIQATMNGRPIDAKGNETMVWVRRGSTWKVAHIHYSHPCPRPAGGTPVVLNGRVESALGSFSEVSA